MHIALALPVPQGTGPTLPPWAPAAKVAPVTMQGYEYALRTLRAGYLYVFFEKNKQGANKWQVWDVSADGQMYPLSGPDWAIPIASMQCNRTGHSGTRLHFIVIEDPDQCTTAWLAFSEHQWSPDTRQRYATDKVLRKKRMLSFEPAALIASDLPNSSCMTAGSQSALETICDYKSSFLPSKLPYNEPPSRIKPISTGEDGSFDESVIKAFHSTRYPWAQGRKGSAKAASDMLRLRSKKKDGSAHSGVLVALPDAIGCTHEMNGYRNDVAGCILRYSEERALQVTAYQSIVGLQKALEGRAGQVARDASEAGMFKWTAENSATRMKNVQAQYPNNPSRIAQEQELCTHWENDGAKKIPAHIARQRQSYLGQSSAVWQTGQARVDQEAAKYTTPTVNTGKSVVQQRDERSSTWQKTAVAEAWPKYQEKINETAFANFKKNWDAMLGAADKIIDTRTEQLIQWLEAPALLAALEDYHPKNLDDGAAFDDKIGSAVMGLSSSQAGRSKIDAWVKEMQAKPTNLLWRAVARNQEEGITAVNEALAHAKAGLDMPLTVESWAAVAPKIKWNKIADLYKKSQSLANTNATAMQSGMKAFTLGGIDQLLVSVGDRVLHNVFAQKVDSMVSEKVMQSIFLLRAGAHAGDVLALVETQAKVEKLDRLAMMRRMYSAQAFTSLLVDDAGNRLNATALADKWNKLTQSANTPDSSGKFNAAKDARLAFVIALLEGFNLAKSGYDAGVKKDAKSMVVLTSAVLSMGAASVDVYTNVVKGMFDDKMIAFQRFKFLGGALSGAASIGSSVASLIDAWHSGHEGKTGLATLNVSNFFVTIGGGGANFLATLTYCGPYLTKVAERQAAKGIAGAAVTRFAAGLGTRWLMYRAVFMGVGLSLNIVGLGIQVAIWQFSDDELQVWCEQCAFGKKRDKQWSEKTQANQLFHATYAYGFRE
jgi:hypothetical protein